VRGLGRIDALEVVRPAEGSGRNPTADPRHEHGQSAVGAPRIHGELLELGIEIGRTSVGEYMARRRGPRSQGWKTSIRNHADGIAVIDLFVAPTISLQLLYGLLIMGHGRRQILWFGLTTHPTAEWIAIQLTKARGRE
jgi:hypothetical protein